MILCFEFFLVVSFLWLTSWVGTPRFLVLLEERMIWELITLAESCSL